MKMIVENLEDRMFNRLRIILLLLVAFLGLTISKEAFAQPAVLDFGTSTDTRTWVFTQPLQSADVKFWMRVQRQGNLNRFGTFDYYFKVQVLRPDGTDVWNTRYGFDEQGYAEQIFSLPILFYDRSASRSNPSFGAWKIRIAMEEKDSRREVSAKEYTFNFVKAGGAPQQPAVQPGQAGNPFPVVPFRYQRWDLQGWGAGIYEEIAYGPDSYDKQIKVLQSRKTFSVKEVANAWSGGHKFGAWLTGPAVSTYRNSNNMPLYLFGYVLYRPNGDADGKNPQYRQNVYCNNPGTAAFAFDLRQPGNYRLEYFIRERDKNYWEEASWVSIGTIDFTLTE
jgi:hypothetical protein